MENYKLTHSEWLELKNDDGTLFVKRKDRIQSKIEDRVKYIFYFFDKTFPDKLTPCYSYIIQRTHPINKRADGWFKIADAVEDCKYPFNSDYNDVIVPIKWLWEDFEEKLSNECQEWKNEKEEEQKTRKRIQEKITKMLTPEELKYITFKN